MMRKHFAVSSCMAMVALFLASATAQAQVIADIDFSAGQGYAAGNLEGQPAGAANVWTSGAANSLTTRFQVVNEQLVVTQNPDDNQWLYIVFPTQTGPFTATFEWQYIGDPASTVDFGFTLSDTENFNQGNNPDIAFGEAGAMIRMNTDPDLDIRDGDWNGGGTYTSLIPYTYQDGAKMSVRLEVDTEGLIFDAYVTKEGESEVMLADDYGFRLITSDVTNGLNCIAMWSNGDEPDNQVILDNIVVAGPAPVSEWSIHE